MTDYPDTSPGSLFATTLAVAGHDGDQIEAYLARPAGERSRGGVVVIHHMPGYDRETKEMVRHFAELGYDAICPNLYSREAPGADPADASAVARSRGGVPDDRLVGDVAGAAAYLRSLPAANGRVGVIGHCSGGRQSVLSACRLDLDAAVDCYGAFVVGEVPAGMDLRITNLIPDLPNLSAPLLGLFGAEDQHPSPEQVAELGRILTEHAKDFEFHSYEGAGHGFFAVNRPAYNVAAANDGWERIAAFFGKHLSTATATATSTSAEG
ncbi:dienelactone hydrolase family protein [Streptomyces cocklensis]|uniref:Carboxymethylenebutenolidase n=1 Tax=Actinacidiphila cocklensis TaxID=887465 RepID=A0A9W4DY75_9ACTN|nr:dienelactone hydrolase family protein [Actinacidiphila cocklensis]MDD1057634.1 dienelactone hydrolase family protein [Actinacidiphila cocklensis]CAG6398331.1 Carboxymethylenebutenolidase [Actinacidiphila cocklensis]